MQTVDAQVDRDVYKRQSLQSAEAGVGTSGCAGDAAYSFAPYGLATSGDVYKRQVRYIVADDGVTVYSYPWRLYSIYHEFGESLLQCRAASEPVSYTHLLQGKIVRSLCFLETSPGLYSY